MRGFNFEYDPAPSVESGTESLSLARLGRRFFIMN